MGTISALKDIISGICEPQQSPLHVRASNTFIAASSVNAWTLQKRRQLDAYLQWVLVDEPELQLLRRLISIIDITRRNSVKMITENRWNDDSYER
jgi:hypothetical protein